jgi:hypothetical protein
MIQTKHSSLLAALMLGLGACANGPAPGLVPDSVKEIDISTGFCVLTETIPATIETVTEQVLVTPAKLAADGSVTAPAIYQSRSRQAIVRERQVVRTDTLCDDQMTPELVASLQRALAVRGYYRGPVTGSYDAATEAAVKSYQNRQGLPSTVLSLATARDLGLVAVLRDAPSPG